MRKEAAIYINQISIFLYSQTEVWLHFQALGSIIGGSSQYCKISGLSKIKFENHSADLTIHLL